MKIKLKNFWGYLLLAAILVLLIYMLLESRQRSKQIEDVLEKTNTVKQ